MSVSAPRTGADDPVWPAWVEGKTMGELGRMLSRAQSHLALFHKRRADDRLVNVIAAVAMTYLEGNHMPPDLWRAQIVGELERALYKEGCCTWRG